MKFPVFKKRQRIGYVVLAVGLLICMILVGVMLAVNGAQESVTAIIVLIVYAILFVIIPTVILFVTGFSDVNIDETGITLCFGKIKLNKIVWTDVRRIELVSCGANFWTFNVMTTDKPSFSFQRGRIVENINKSRITFAYDEKARELITQYYNGKIIKPKPE